MFVRVRVEFKNRDKEWHINLTPDFNGHADNKKALRRAAMKELDEKGLSAWKQYTQKVEQHVR